MAIMIPTMHVISQACCERVLAIHISISCGQFGCLAVDVVIITYNSLLFVLWLEICKLAVNERLRWKTK